jgi:hypothetical protein
MANEPVGVAAEDNRKNGDGSLDDDPVAPMIARSLEAFRRDLPQLLKTHRGRWVAYHGDQQIGFARNGNALFEKCFRRGLKADEFLVRLVLEEIADEDITWSWNV